MPFFTQILAPDKHVGLSDLGHWGNSSDSTRSVLKELAPYKHLSQKDKN